MKRIAVLVLVASFSFLACAGFGEKRRLEKFEEVAETYKRALLASDFRGAAQFIEPGEQPRRTDFKEFALVKIVEYKPTRLDVSEEHRRIEQDVALQYFLLNSNRLRNLHYSQIWAYNETHKRWLLQTDLPAFDQ